MRLVRRRDARDALPESACRSGGRSTSTTNRCSTRDPRRALPDVGTAVVRKIRSPHTTGDEARFRGSTPSTGCSGCRSTAAAHRRPPCRRHSVRASRPSLLPPPGVFRSNRSAHTRIRRMRRMAKTIPRRPQRRALPARLRAHSESGRAALRARPGLIAISHQLIRRWRIVRQVRQLTVDNDSRRSATSPQSTSRGSETVQRRA